MDWVRLGNSGKDLAGVGGAFLDVTKEQLEKHNKTNDAWLCIRGKNLLIFFLFMCFLQLTYILNTSVTEKYRNLIIRIWL